eukprot:861922-Rhodomonas_salina.1
MSFSCCCSCAAARYVVAHGSSWRRRGRSAGKVYAVHDESSDQRFLCARGPAKTTQEESGWFDSQ